MSSSSSMGLTVADCAHATAANKRKESVSFKLYDMRLCAAEAEIVV
jgi:hypothetical protein